MSATVRLTLSIHRPHDRAPLGDPRRQHSIRVNDQWRVCFTWRDGSAWSVEIVDYH